MFLCRDGHRTTSISPSNAVLFIVKWRKASERTSRFLVHFIDFLLDFRLKFLDGVEPSQEWLLSVDNGAGLQQCDNNTLSTDISSFPLLILDTHLFLLHRSFSSGRLNVVPAQLPDLYLSFSHSFLSCFITFFYVLIKTILL